MKPPLPRGTKVHPAHAGMGRLQHITADPDRTTEIAHDAPAACSSAVPAPRGQNNFVYRFPRNQRPDSYCICQGT